MSTVHLLLHENPETKDIKCIGIYSSRQAAGAAVDRLSAKPGFREAREGFSIDSYAMDRDHWEEGYGV